MGIYFIFAGIGTAAATAWVYAGTTLVMWTKRLDIDSVLAKLTATLGIFWNWTDYPKLWYRYAKVNRMTFGGAAISLLSQGVGSIKQELKTVEHSEVKRESQAGNAESSDPAEEV